MQPAQHAQVVDGTAAITWPGDGRCRRTIADVDEPSKNVIAVHACMAMFDVPCVRLLSDDED